MEHLELTQHEADLLLQCIEEAVDRSIENLDDDRLCDLQELRFKLQVAGAKQTEENTP